MLFPATGSFKQIPLFSKMRWLPIISYSQSENALGFIYNLFQIRTNELPTQRH